MRKDINSSRSANFIKRNSLLYPNAINYVKILCEEYDLTNFYIKEYKDDEIGLFLAINNQTYIIHLDEKFVELKVRNQDGFVIRVFTKDNCWREAIKFTVEREGLI